LRAFADGQVVVRSSYQYYGGCSCFPQLSHYFRYFQHLVVGGVDTAVIDIDETGPTPECRAVAECCLVPHCRTVGTTED
jgi:hypothetical protein